MHNVTTPWILDTGANFSTISESFAKQLGFTLSTGVAQTQGATGAENKLHIAILDTLELGGATLHNIVLLVLPDANLTIPIGKHQTYITPAILGYPPFAALSTIRFTHDHHFLAGPNLTLSGNSSPIYMDKLTPLVAAETHGHTHVFEFDSGANSTNLFASYYKDYQLDFLNQKHGQSHGYGAGGSVTQSVFILNDFTLKLGGHDATLHHIPVQLAPIHALSDHYEGTLSRYLLAGFTSITLDFANARFYLGAPLPQ